MAAIKSRRPAENFGPMGAYVPRMIFVASPFKDCASNACLEHTAATAEITGTWQLQRGRKAWRRT